MSSSTSQLTCREDGQFGMSCEQFGGARRAGVAVSMVTNAPTRSALTSITKVLNPVPQTDHPSRRSPGSLTVESLLVHGGNEIREESRAVRLPIVMGNSYYLPEDTEGVDLSDPDLLVYTRNAGVNQLGLQSKLAALEGAEEAAVFGTGVAALHAVLFTTLNSGDHVVVSSIVYDAVWRLLEDLLPKKYGVEVTFVNSADLDEVRAAMKTNTKLVHSETIANPTTQVVDVAGLADIAHEHGALLSIDSTFTPPVFFRPLEHGADLVVHSLTKYINGHGDALGGSVAGSRALIHTIKADALVEVGGAISPFNAWLITRGSVTLQLRYERHLTNAQELAEALENDPRVAFVSYPGLVSHPQHALATRQFEGRGYGAMMAFAVRGDAAAQEAFVGALKLITSAVSLGHDESLIVNSARESRRGFESYPPEFHEWGHLRLSVGLENITDLIRDVKQALDHAVGPLTDA